MLQRLEIQLASEQGLDKFVVIKHNAIHARSSQEGLHKFMKQKAMGDSRVHRKPIWLRNSLRHSGWRLGKCLGGESYMLVLLL